MQVPRNIGRLQRENVLEEDALIVGCDVTVEEEVEVEREDEGWGEQGGEGECGDVD